MWLERCLRHRDGCGGSSDTIPAPSWRGVRPTRRKRFHRDKPRNAATDRDPTRDRRGGPSSDGDIETTVESRRAPCLCPPQLASTSIVPASGEEGGTILPLCHTFEAVQKKRVKGTNDQHLRVKDVLVTSIYLPRRSLSCLDYCSSPHPES